MSDADRKLFDLAARQHGCLTFAQAHACGLSPTQLRTRLDSARLVRQGDHVLVVGGLPERWEQQLMAGLLDLGPDSVVSYRAAAAFHGFDGFPSIPVEFTVPRRRRGRRSTWTVHTSRRLEGVDLEVHGPLRCTSPSRTIIDLAAVVSSSELERAIDSAVHSGMTAPHYLAQRLQALRGRGRTGVRLVEALLPDSGGHSPLERAFLSLVRRAGFPRPRCQRIFAHDGRRVARVDFTFEASRVIVEVSGRRGHASDTERANDARRRNELQALGYVVLEFTSDDVRQRSAYVLGMLRRHGIG